MEPIVWIIGGGTAAYLLLKEKPKPTTPEAKAEEISEEAANRVEEIATQVENGNGNGTGNGGDEFGSTPGDDVNEDGTFNVLDIVARVNESLNEYTNGNGNGNGNGTFVTPGLEELNEEQRSLFESLSDQRGCVRIYEDQEIADETQEVYLLLETEKGWKVKEKPLQEGSLVVRTYLCPPGREPLEW